MAKYNKNDLHREIDVFLDCTKPFFQGALKDYLVSPYSFFVKDITRCTDDGSKCIQCTKYSNCPVSINYNHEFWNIYPSARWVVQAIVSEYLLSAEHAESKYLPTPSEYPEIRKNIGLKLKRSLEALVNGLDLDVIAAISGERYESSEGKNLSLTIVPYPLTVCNIENMFPNGTIIFKDNAHYPLSFKNVHAVRKQLNMCISSNLGVYTKLDKGRDPHGVWSLNTFGLLPVEATLTFPTITYKKNMEWAFFLPGDNSAARIEYSRGRLLCPNLDYECKYYSEIENILKAWPSLPQNTVKRYSKSLSELIILVKKQAKKGALIFFSTHRVIHTECRRLCTKWNRGIHFTKSVNLKNESTAKELTSIDGAVMARFDGACLGCGIILDGEAQVKGDMSRGARYNSAENYFEFLHSKFPNEPAIGLVVSEDGMVDLFPKRNNQYP